MKKLLLVLVVALTSCAGMMNTGWGKYYFSKGSTVESIGERSARAKVSYESLRLLKKNVEDDFNAGVITKSERVTRLNYANKRGGHLWVNIYAATIGAANTKYWHCIITDKNGKEIKRETGSDRIASLPVTPESPWSNIMLVSLDTVITDQFSVRVIDGLGTPKVSNFIVYPDQDKRITESY